jgi:hypothetical protein
MELITPWTIYWVMTADAIWIMFGWLTAFSVALVVLTIIIICWYNDDVVHKRITGTPVSYKWPFLPAGLAVFFLICAVFFPSTKTAVMMFGIPAAMKVTTQAVTDLGLDETARSGIAALNKMMGEYIKEDTKK